MIPFMVFKKTPVRNREINRQDLLQSSRLKVSSLSSKIEGSGRNSCQNSDRGQFILGDKMAEIGF